MPRFHVFLSHKSSDKPAVRALKQALAGQGLKCWLDEEQLRPGLPWQDLLEQGIKGSGSVAVCVAADGLGPWEDEEMQSALRLAVKDGRPVIPVILPGAPAQPELPLFLGNRTWVDLRGGLTAEGIAKLFWGITGEQPEEWAATSQSARAAAATGPADSEPTVPSETAFLDEVFERLHTYPTLILLAQEERDQLSSIRALRESSRARFGADRVLHLAPPRNPDADEAGFFHALGRRAGMTQAANSAMDFEAYLEGRLAGGERLFLLIGGLGNCADAGREQLADILRGLFDYHGDALRVVLAGGEKLAELKYAQGDLSLLSHAEPLHWPELNTGDLMDLARRAHPAVDLSPEQALRILEASGGHPRLIQEALRCHAHAHDHARDPGASLDPCSHELGRSRQIEAQITALTQQPDAARRLAAWLDQTELGPYREWIRDPLLRRLYWMNLLRADGPPGRERLVWRCPAVVAAGRRVLG